MSAALPDDLVLVGRRKFPNIVDLNVIHEKMFAAYERHNVVFVFCRCGSQQHLGYDNLITQILDSVGRFAGNLRQSQLTGRYLELQLFEFRI